MAKYLSYKEYVRQGDKIRNSGKSLSVRKRLMDKLNARWARELKAVQVRNARLIQKQIKANAPKRR